MGDSQMVGFVIKCTQGSIHSRSVPECALAQEGRKDGSVVYTTCILSDRVGIF